jgi:hypothetical protein
VTGIEVAAISLSAAVVKSAARIWLGNNQFADDMSAELVDLLAGRVTSAFDQRRVRRFFDDCADIVGKRVVALLDAEFRDVPDNERQAAVLTVAETFARAEVTVEKLFQADLDARLVERNLRSSAVRVLSAATLSDGGEQVYWLVLRESCAYTVEVITTLPKFQAGALTEVLRRETTILVTLQNVLDRLPQRRGANDFTADYNRVVANKLDRLELLGVTLADANRRYPLSVAYISLSVVRRRAGGFGQLAGRVDSGPTDGAAQRIESVFGAEDRVLIMGAAGSGKTTLLQWLAVHSARSDFSESLTSLNDRVPFFLPLRRYVNRGLPAPEQFPLTVGAHIANDMPPGWVHDLLRTGKALVLVDGVDEMPEAQRFQVRDWLSDLVDTFPRTKFMITSRPAAVEDGWLDWLKFTSTELQPMSTTDIAEFVHQWHAAVGTDALDVDERAALDDYERSLMAAIDTDRHLRALTVSPLLCALLCALNRERRTHLPADRMEIYSAALDMLLDRRDRERGVEPSGLQLTRGDKVLLLQDIAFWLVRNGWSSAVQERVVGQISRSVMQLRSVTADPRAVYRNLLERSGLLREPAVGQVDFVHRTFQEYLAGKAAAENDEIGLLVKNAHDDQWREVVVMAAGHARPDQCAELLHGVLRRGRRRGQRDSLLPLAVVAAHSARRIDPQLRTEIDQITEQLVPPANLKVAEALADTGELLLALLRAKPPRTTEEAQAAIHAVTKIGGRGAMEIISEILAGQHVSADDDVIGAVINAWRFFKPRQYMTEVLMRSWPPERALPVSEPAFMEVLCLFTELRAVSCEFGNFGPQHTVAALNALEANRELRAIRLTDCPSYLDLSPLRRLPRFESLAISGHGELLDISRLAGLQTLRELVLHGSTTSETLRMIDRFPALERLEIRGLDDITDLMSVPALPRSLRALSLSGCAQLRSLDGVDRWDALTGLELFDFPQLSDLTPIAEMGALNWIGIGVLHVDTIDLSPLAGLAQLKEIVLLGHGVFNLSGLRGKQNTTVHVPVGSQVFCADDLGPGSTVAEYTAQPRVASVFADWS